MGTPPEAGWAWALAARNGCATSSTSLRGPERGRRSPSSAGSGRHVVQGNALKTNIVVAIREQTHVAEARRAAAALSRSVGFPEQAAGRLAIVVTEAASNLIKHADGGSMLLNAREESGRSLVELL